MTNLNDDGAGSFRDAVSAPRRTVVFDVGGIVSIESRISVASEITIAGQTAPGDGVTIYGNGLSFTDANECIVRYLRVRMGLRGDEGRDAITIARGQDMIFDHVSVSWGRDENFSVSGNVRNITIQNCIIAQGLHPHSCGGLIQTSGGVSLLRNLYIDNHTRNPKVKGVNQFVNNVVYNWRVAAYILGDSAGDSYANVIGNCFVDGPDTGSAAFTRGNLNFHLYADGNVRDADKDGTFDPQELARLDYDTVDWKAGPYDYPPIETLSAEEAYRRVVAGAGASLARDAVDRRLIEELTSLGTMGQVISDEMQPPMNGPGVIANGECPEDTDRDGMPDDWETAHGLDPQVPDDAGDRDGDGITNIEDYLNGIVRGDWSN